MIEHLNIIIYGFIETIIKLFLVVRPKSDSSSGRQPEIAENLFSGASQRRLRGRPIFPQMISRAPGQTRLPLRPQFILLPVFAILTAKTIREDRK